METVTVNISFKKSLLEEIDKAAKQEMRTRSEFLREAARAYIEKGKKQEREYHMDVLYGQTINIPNGILENTKFECAQEEGSNKFLPENVGEKAREYNKSNKTYTYVDYLKWAGEEKYELIDGIPFNMAPAPSTLHQSVCIALSAELYNSFKNKPCKVFAGPLDVRLPREGESEDEKIVDVVQPDILIVCDNSKLDAKGCLGAPDLIVEIISPWTSQKDSITKLNLYEKAGVSEYWLIRPEERTVMVFTLGENKKYGRPETYSHNDILKSSIFAGLEIILKDIFITQ